MSFYATYVQESEISSLGITFPIRHHGVLGSMCPKRRGDANFRGGTLDDVDQNKIRQTTSYDKNHTIIQFYEHVVLFYVIYLKLYEF